MVAASDGSLKLYDDSAGNSTLTSGPTWMVGGKIFETLPDYGRRWWIGDVSNSLVKKWWALWDSNPGPTD